MKFKIDDPMAVMVRVKGTNGKVRELSAIFDFNWPYTCVMKMDAASLGYIEVLNRPQEWATLRPDQVPTILNMRGIELCTQISLKEISLGSLVAKEVEAVVLEINPPPLIPVDVVLGRTFLKNFKTVFDSKAGFLSLR